MSSEQNAEKCPKCGYGDTKTPFGRHCEQNGVVCLRNQLAAATQSLGESEGKANQLELDLIMAKSELATANEAKEQAERESIQSELRLIQQITKRWTECNPNHATADDYEFARWMCSLVRDRKALLAPAVEPEMDRVAGSKPEERTEE